LNEPAALSLGTYLRNARKAAGLSQTDLAKLAGISRTQLVKAESGQYVPNVAEATELARVLKIPWERLISGRDRPFAGLRGIAFELYHLGITDLQIAHPRVPGAFRRPEQVLALALRGDAPDPRIVEAIPFVLARQSFVVPLTLAFADIYDPRIRHRLAWLSQITLALDQSNRLPVAIESERQLSGLVRRARKPDQADSLGHPSRKKPSPIWARWNITYAGTLDEFHQRAIEVAKSFERTALPRD